MALNIKNKAVESLATEVAAMTGETKTEAIRVALEERKRLLERRRTPAGGQDLASFLEHEIWPIVPHDQRGKRLSRNEEDDILGYGASGV